MLYTIYIYIYIYTLLNRAWARRAAPRRARRAPSPRGPWASETRDRYILSLSIIYIYIYIYIYDRDSHHMDNY